MTCAARDRAQSRSSLAVAWRTSWAWPWQAGAASGPCLSLMAPSHSQGASQAAGLRPAGAPRGLLRRQQRCCDAAPANVPRRARGVGWTPRGRSLMPWLTPTVVVLCVLRPRCAAHAAGGRVQPARVHQREGGAGELQPRLQRVPHHARCAASAAAAAAAYAFPAKGAGAEPAAELAMPHIATCAGGRGRQRQRSERDRARATGERRRWLCAACAWVVCRGEQASQARAHLAQAAGVSHVWLWRAAGVCHHAQGGGGGRQRAAGAARDGRRHAQARERCGRAQGSLTTKEGERPTWMSSALFVLTPISAPPPGQAPSPGVPQRNRGRTEPTCLHVHPHAAPAKPSPCRW